MRHALTKLIFTLSFIGLMVMTGFNGFGQDLSQSRKTSYYTYIYQLTNQETEQLYRTPKMVAKPALLHTLVDSFPTDSSFTRKLALGHYLKVYTSGNKLEVSLTNVQNFSIYVFNNSTDLCIQVFDSVGNLISDAELEIEGKSLKYNPELHAYFKQKSNQHGLLKVHYKGQIGFYQLDREYPNSGFRRTTRTVSQTPPIKYIWQPIHFVGSLPVDGVKSLRVHYGYGTIGKAGHFFSKIGRGIGRIFTKEDNDEWGGGYGLNPNKGYFVFNKPKFKPGDTVRFKTFLVNKRGKPLNKDLSVFLGDGTVNKKLTLLSPYQKGGYAYEFVLADSLDLRLDKSYNVTLKDKRGRKYISGAFKYEDYELSGLKLKTRVNEQIQYHGDSTHLFLKATDENDLNLLDARVEIFLTPDGIIDLLDTAIFMPDTLLFLTKDLDPEGETEIVWQDNHFPKTNFNYKVKIRMMTADNEVVEATENVKYYYKKDSLKTDLDNDSLKVRLLANGKEIKGSGKVFGLDNFQNKTLLYEGAIPCKLPIQPYFSQYLIQSDSLSQNLDLNWLPANILAQTKRTTDSVFIKIQNPRKIPFLYDVYRGNKKILTGYNDSLKAFLPESKETNYYLSLRYLWAGKVKIQNVSIPLVKDRLKIEVTQPRLVYPGQESEIKIKVSDYKGNPVPDVDLTAFGLTQKFDYTAPNLPNLNRSEKRRQFINEYKVQSVPYKDFNPVDLDYSTWRLIAGLDSIPYYQFLYPDNGFYRSETTSKEGITQFAPYVVSKGNLLPVGIIYLDDVPIYFSGTTVKTPYSFSVEPGVHKVTLRTENFEIQIPKVYFKPGKKLIFSIDKDVYKNGTTVVAKQNLLSQNERRYLYRFLIPYTSNFGSHFAFFQKGDFVQFLKSGPTRYYNQYSFAGPQHGDLTFNLIDSFSIPFKHDLNDPYYEYTFEKGLIKMKSADTSRYPKWLNTNIWQQPFNDFVLTRENISYLWQLYLDQSRKSEAVYDNPDRSDLGMGELNFQMSFPVTEKLSRLNYPINIVVLKVNDSSFTRVYKGADRVIYQLDSGYYQLLFFYPGAKFFQTDTFFIGRNGTSYRTFKQPVNLSTGRFAMEISRLIEQKLFLPSKQKEDQKSQMNQAIQYQLNNVRINEGNEIEGYVRDEKNKGISFASVQIEGTEIGALTDLSGYFRIDVQAKSGGTLLVRTTGYHDGRLKIDPRRTFYEIKLSPTIFESKNVMVLGYGADNLREKGVSTDASNATDEDGNYLGVKWVPEMSFDQLAAVLQGLAPGLQVVQGQPGAGAKFKLRGVGSRNDANSPLIVINGEIYNGSLLDLDPSLIRNATVLRDATATSLYGSRGANGVILLDFKEGADLPKGNGADFDESFYQAVAQVHSIRNNFSDYAYWQPKLRTNKQGEASFKVQFPDDVTSWQTHVLAMNGKRQAGQTSDLIKSYKPLMAQLSLPRFLVEGDSTQIVGKILNYTHDSTKVTSKFMINDSLVQENQAYCVTSVLDTLPLIAKNDSLELTYTLNTADDYFDGEKRNIAVFPKGLEVTKGQFLNLSRDTNIRLSFDPDLRPITLYASSNALDIVEQGIDQLVAYRYDCNEQTASKLEGWLAKKELADFRKQRFKGKKQVKKLLNLLQKNRNDDGLWGWWGTSEKSLWISRHVLETIQSAQEAGFDFPLNKTEISRVLLADYLAANGIQEKVTLLGMLDLVGADLNYAQEITTLERKDSLTLNLRLQLATIRQNRKMTIDWGALNKYAKTDLWGNPYYAEIQTNQQDRVISNELQNTLLMYRLLRKDSLGRHQQKLQGLLNYLMTQHKTGDWGNTYNASRVIKTLLPALIIDSLRNDRPQLVIKGAVDSSINKFPFTYTFASGTKPKIEIEKKGLTPVYLSTSQRYWEPSPIERKNNFEIETKFENERKDSVLLAGKETQLKIHVKVEKDADYLMINVPIPAGCTYTDKAQGHYPEVHREYFQNETTLFFNHLKAGTYDFHINLLSRFTGKYTLNPAKVELMYFPEFNGNNRVKTVEVE